MIAQAERYLIQPEGPTPVAQKAVSLNGKLLVFSDGSCVMNNQKMINTYALDEVKLIVAAAANNMRKLHPDLHPKMQEVIKTNTAFIDAQLSALAGARFIHSLKGKA